MMHSFEVFGGVDFSGAKEPLSNLWSAVGCDVNGRLRIVSLRPHAFRKDLAGFVVGGWRSVVDDARDRILWGLDFPFGVPANASRAFGVDGSWRSVVDWVADRPADEVRAVAGEAAKLLRAGDTPGALAPLDLRLYKQTVEGLRWLQYLDEIGDVSINPQRIAKDASVTLVEVYPSGTARDLGLPQRRAPSRPAEARARAAALRTFLDFESPDAEAAAANLEDAWDATVACLTAFLCREDLDQPGREGGAHRAAELAVEGWIFRPPAVMGK